MGAIRSNARRIAGVAAAIAVISAGFAVGSAPAPGLLPGAVPDAVDDEYTVTYSASGTTLNVPAGSGLLANDSGPQGTFVWPDGSDTTSAVGNATLTLNSNGSFTYQLDPQAEFSGSDWFDYTIVDKNPNTNDDYEESFATVYISVDAVVADDSFYGKVNSVLDVSTPGVYKNDAGIDPSFPDYDADTTAGGNVTLDDIDGSFEYIPPDQFSGVDTFTYTVSDLNFDNTYTATVNVYVDSTKPTVAMVDPSKQVNLSTQVTGKWSGADALSGIKNYDVQGQSAAWNGSYGSWSTKWSATTSTSKSSSGSYGRTYCLRTRARDRSSNISDWSAKKCTAIPLRSGSLSYSSGWTTMSSSGYFAGSARRTTTTGAKMTKTGVKAKYVYLVVSKCASCGTLQVRWNGNVTANVSLYSPTTVRKQVVKVVNLASAQTGTISATVTSSGGKSATIEGLAAYRG